MQQSSSTPWSAQLGNKQQNNSLLPDLIPVDDYCSTDDISGDTQKICNFCSIEYYSEKYWAF